MSSSTEDFARALSRLLGWIYTFAWSLSFYPQPLLNYHRRATTGSTIDFPTINIIGFFFYFLSTSLLLWHPEIRSQYAARHSGHQPTVRGNDVAFAGHAVVLSTITLSMFWGSLWGFKQRKGQRCSRAVLGVCLGSITGVLWVAMLVHVRGTGDPLDWAAIDIVYAMGYAKLLITVLKYIPQVWENYKRKSTVGWSIGQILCDIVGGVLSIVQLLIDSNLQGDWSGVTGNPVKFGLGNVSIFFDIIFMTQHYVIYRNPPEEGERRSERRGLLAHEDV